ncbi:glycosyltransferase family 2 protein [Candidatus Magnetominusculus dajiuhuensis]|uniref:glycosyltransferase family 2 protein n=1 Tax=Candidatus Magnetominusculus dajiuhuensis TaxID=3137712 RepID=UPI003B433E4B
MIYKKICAAIPAFNAAATVGAVVRGSLRHLSRVYVVDDGSTDDTAEEARAAGAEVIHHAVNMGKGQALRAIFERAARDGFEAVVTLDADLQHDPSEIPLFLSAHTVHPDDIIVGSRMREKDKIPRDRYNSMHVARFYISLAANQFIEDTQCGFRLYPMSVVRAMELTGQRYVTETEALIKAGDSGATVRFVDVRAIYGENGSHFRPVMDIMAITAYVISYLTIKWLKEGVSSNEPNTYRAGYAIDRLHSCTPLSFIYQLITVLTALPITVFFLIEFMLGKGNFAAIRRLGVSFKVITAATQVLPGVLIVGAVDKFLRVLGSDKRYIDDFLDKWYPNIWGGKG